jgi:hypothetical protein
MTLIDSITDQANQTIGLILDSGVKITMTLVYKSNQQGWFYSLSQGSVSLFKNRRMVASPNMLRAFRDVLPFGLACATSDGYEPIFADDFSSGRAKLYLLNAADLAIVESTIIGAFV